MKTTQNKTAEQDINKDLKQVEKILGISFKNLDLLNQALTHRSYLNEHPQFTLGHNERLEFLGDAVLELVISEYLFKNYPKRPEGELTSFRSAVVKTETLAQASRTLNLGQYLKMAKGEADTGGHDKDYLLANMFEAIIGAIYMDQGYNTSKSFILSQLKPVLKNIIANRLDIDAKTKFQEIAQQIFKETPKYVLVSQKGPDHQRIFVMAVRVKNKTYGIGEGKTKQKAEEQAAEAAIKVISKS